MSLTVRLIISKEGEFNLTNTSNNKKCVITPEMCHSNDVIKEGIRQVGQELCRRDCLFAPGGAEAYNKYPEEKATVTMATKGREVEGFESLCNSMKDTVDGINRTIKITEEVARKFNII